ncbi:hypothetical protein IHE45_06G080600 [Dioscorea alata]|uniref:Uncharacterized protein n=1 Tax=Dioscorea alata TaxID=55571 RepID=A0ACB7VXX1_DIOAL|nr:hypothetical protein IHE45_06G080600 [Dioscorea alata]
MMVVVLQGLRLSMCRRFLVWLISFSLSRLPSASSCVAGVRACWQKCCCPVAVFGMAIGKGTCGLAI